MEKEYEHLLSVQDLHTSFFTDNGEVQAVNGVSFNLDAGKVLGIVGESGSGKSVTAYSIMADGNGGVFKSDENDGYFDVYGIDNDYEGTVEKARTLLKAAGYKFDDQGMTSTKM